MKRDRKKAILGMFVAIVMSFGVMGGISSTSNDLNLQQVSVGSAWIAAETEVGPGATSAWATLAVITGYATGQMTANGTAALPATATNPYGWGYWCLTGVLAL